MPIQAVRPADVIGPADERTLVDLQHHDPGVIKVRRQPIGADQDLLPAAHRLARYSSSSCSPYMVSRSAPSAGSGAPGAR